MKPGFGTSNLMLRMFTDEETSTLLDDRLWLLTRELNLIKRPRRINKPETEMLLELLEGWSFKDNWDAVIEWASRAVRDGCSFRYSSKVYRYWLEALYRNYDYQAVFSLCRHLMSFRKETNEFLALALYGLSLIGKDRYARPIAKFLFKLPKKSVLIAESLAKYNIEFLSKKRRVSSLSILEKVCSRDSADYFSFMNWFESSLESNDHDHAARAVMAMSRAFPVAPEPLRTAAHLAIDQRDWSESTRIFRYLIRLNPFKPEYSLGLAGSLEHKGELFAARNVLRESSSLFSEDDYDFSATMGNVSYKLYKQYAEEGFRTEAIRAFSNCLRVAPAHKIATANFHLFLYELKAGVGENIIAVDRKSNDVRFWLCVADDKSWKHGLVRESFLMKLPTEATAGDIIFMCRGRSLQGEKTCKIFGVMKILTPPVPDEYLERVLKVGDFKMFEEPVVYHFVTEPIMEHDGHGLYNFSVQRSLYFAEFPSVEAEKVVAQVESLDKSYLDGHLGRSINTHGVRNYA